MVSRKKVLVIEDERPIAEPLADALRREGFDVHLAATAADGLATAICVAGEALAPTLLAAYPQMRAILTRLDGTSMTFTAKG